MITMLDVFLIILLLMGFVCMIRGGVALWRRNHLADKEQSVGLFINAILFLSFSVAVAFRLVGYTL